MMNKKKIALFGGAFDPITKSHEKIIAKLLEHRLVDEVWLVPCYISGYNKKMSPFENRMEMCQLIAQKYQQVSVNDFELQCNSSGNTYETLLKFLEKYQDPMEEFYFVIGMDNANKIHTWKNWEKLVELIKFIIIPRKNYTIEKVNESFVRSQYIFDALEEDGSSTQARKDIMETGTSNIVDNEIINYIHSKKLYSSVFHRNYLPEHNHLSSVHDSHTG